MGQKEGPEVGSSRYLLDITKTLGLFPSAIFYFFFLRVRRLIEIALWPHQASEL